MLNEVGKNLWKMISADIKFDNKTMAPLHFCIPLRVRVTVSVKSCFFMMNHQQKKGGTKVQ